MMSEYETRLREAVRSLFPLEMKPIRGERIQKTSPATGAIRLESTKLLEAEDLRTLFSGGGVEPSVSSQFNDRRF
jgi:hypothetical protein